MREDTPPADSGRPLPFPIIDAPERIFPPLITDFGRHTARTWAEHIVPHFVLFIPPSVKPKRRRVLEACQRTAIEQLVGWFEGVLENERKELDAQGAERLDAKVDCALEAYGAVGELIKAAKGTAIEGFWSRPEVQNQAAIEIAHHLRTAAFVERLWWVDEHPESNAGAAWRAQHFKDAA